MTELVRLPLTTADGRPLVHKFFRHREEAAGLLVVLPGNLYGVDGALLYYPSLILGRRGWDTLAVTYGFQSTMGEAWGDAVAATLAECQAALRAALADRSYPRIGLMGKSMGSSVAARLCSSEPRLASCRTAYLTPLVGSPLFDTLFSQTTQPAYLALGTADPLCDLAALEGIRSVRPFELTLIDNADHSLYVEGDLEASFAALRRVTSEVVAFLSD